MENTEERITPMSWNTRFCTFSVAVAALGLLGALAGTSTAKADEVVLGHLSIQPIDNLKTTIPQKIKLTDKKPAGITVEPTYRGAVQYGSISLGNSKRSTILLALDTFPGDKQPHLYVDVNGNGNLTDDPVILLHPLTEFAVSKNASESIALPTNIKSTLPIGAVVPTLARYDFKGSVQEVKSPVLFTLIGDELDYASAVKREGTLNVAGRDYKIRLVDVNENGVFNPYAHDENKSAVVKLQVERNGVFDSKRGTFDLAKPFHLAGNNYEVASIDPQGTIIALQKTDKRGEGAVTAADLAVGSDVIEFDARTIEGKMVHFPSDYKHKIVLLDFWATWCPPCREEIPGIVATYNQFHPKGFEILGVSLDQANDLNGLISFMQQAGMTWPEIYDGKYWNAEIAKLYEIDSIPRAFLVDGDTGTILAMGDSLRGEGLQREVYKAMQKKHMLAQR